MEKREIIEMAREYVCPGKINVFGQIGIDLVIGNREGPYIFDTDGKRLIDLHINGGVFNLGHDSRLRLLGNAMQTVAPPGSSVD